MVNLSDQVALVTGACRVVGRGVAFGLAVSGANVFATGRSIKQSELGADITTIVCDHTSDKAVAEVFQDIDERVGRLDILVNVAGAGTSSLRGGGRRWSQQVCERLSWRVSTLPDGWSQRVGVSSCTSRPRSPLAPPALEWRRESTHLHR